VAVNLARLVRGMEELLRGALGESTTLAIHAPEALWNTLVDRDQLQNVILNLAINARDAMDGVGSVEITLDNLTLAAGDLRSRPDLAAGDYVVLAMKDSGTGITPEVRERAFEPFFTTKAEGAGTGLGLAMAYGFVAQSGGHIDIDGVPGAGTTVRLFLPRSTALESAALDTASPAPQGGNEHILVVEDDDAVRDSVCTMLGQLGYRVRSAGDAQTALDMLRQGVPADLVFTDVVMPGPLRAPDMVRAALVLRPGLAVLYASGHTRGAVLQGVGGAEPLLLNKPYRREQLARCVRQALAQAATSRAGQQVLVVEQQEDSRQIVCDMLSLLGHAPHGVASLEQARVALAESATDVLLVADDVADREQAGDIASTYPSLRLVMVGEAPEGMKTVLIDKPYSMDKLRAAIGGAS
jgi:CheY-like chemotaxis protein